MLTLWLPLVPVDRTSGALSLVKGSHRLGKIWPATVPPEERSLDRKTTFSDLTPRPAVVGRDPSAEWGVSENWPQGVGQYGDSGGRDEARRLAGISQHDHVRAKSCTVV